MINPAKRRGVLGWLGAALVVVLLAGAMPASAHGFDIDAIKDIRRNHMKILMHQRDLTVHKGIRPFENSLTSCIVCHVNPKTNSVASSKGDFCMGCHSYVGVKLDCFECHSDKPESAGRELHPPVPPTEGKDKQSSLSGKMPRQMLANLSSSNIGGGVK
ncbi:MAG: hypothetical protein ACYCTW_04720 [Sulfuricella sp.]